MHSIHPLTSFTCTDQDRAVTECTVPECVPLLTIYQRTIHQNMYNNKIGQEKKIIVLSLVLKFEGIVFFDDEFECRTFICSTVYKRGSSEEAPVN